MAKKKKVVIACGKGIATAAMVVGKVKDLLLKNDIDADVINVKVDELKDYDGDADLFVSTVKIDESQYETPTIVGTQLLVGFNDEKIQEDIVKILKEEDK